MRIAVPLAALALATSAGVGRSGEIGVTDVPFEILRTGSIGGKTIILSQLTIARDDTTFQALWAQLKVPATAFDPSTAPSVDFAHWMVVAFFGSQGASCDPYRLTRIIARPDRITLHIRHQLPVNCICASMVGEPYIIAKMSWTERPIDFEIEPEFHECR